jgi:hypothetical protein
MTHQNTSTFSRRRILAAIGLSGAAAAVATPPLPLSWTRRPESGSWWDRTPGSLGRGAMDEWKQQVGSTFTAGGENSRSTLKLVKVVPLNSGGRRPSSLGRDQAFAAVFEAQNAAPPAGDRTYTLEQQGAGRMDIFMTAASPSKGTPRLEAVFN